MAQSVRSELTCDACKADDIHNTEAETTPPVVMGKGKALLLDLCEPHRKELYDPLADLLARDGRSEDGTRRRRKRKPAAEPTPEPEPTPTRVEITSHICPTCSRSDFKTDASMRQHHTRVHGEKLAPADQEPLIDDDGCPDCGKSGFKNRGAHRAKAHGFRVADRAHIP